MQILRYLAIVGNAAYVLWIVYDGINGGFQTITPIEVTAYIAVLLLLALNIGLLFTWERER